MNFNDEVENFMKRLDTLTIKELIESKEKLQECLLKLSDYASMINYPKYLKMIERQTASNNINNQHKRRLD